VTARDAAPTVAPEVVPPTRVTVPARGLDAPVEPVGAAPDGQMAIPDDVERAGWYRFGPVPGAPGSAVVAGHVDDAEQGLGAMAALREAEPGDEVVLTDAAGAATRWRVVSRESLDKQALPVDVLFRRDGPPRLTLVTCGGPFLPEVGGYRDNVVVVAEPVR
jgi:sortase (surface protein transpeptidase)